MLSVILLSIIMLRVIWLTVVMLTVVILSVVISGVVVQKVVLLTVVMLSVFMLRVEAFRGRPCSGSLYLNFIGQVSFGGMTLSRLLEHQTDLFLSIFSLSYSIKKQLITFRLVSTA